MILVISRERMGAQTNASVGGVLIVAFVVGSIFAIFFLMQTVELDSLATPTSICWEEIEATVAIFLVAVAVMQPAKDAFDRSRSTVSRLLRMKVELPRPIRAVALVALICGSFGFAFWATADVLGGYNGYGYSFATHPILQLIHNSTIGLVPYIGTRDKGTQASFYLSLAVIGLVALRLKRGVGAALKDSLTLFAAPCLVIFGSSKSGYTPQRT